ncbi:unnamed protein product [Urochloa humidicola]
MGRRRLGSSSEQGPPTAPSSDGEKQSGLAQGATGWAWLKRAASDGQGPAEAGAPSTEDRVGVQGEDKAKAAAGSAEGSTRLAAVLPLVPLFPLGPLPRQHAAHLLQEAPQLRRWPLLPPALATAPPPLPVTMARARTPWTTVGLCSGGSK